MKDTFIHDFGKYKMVLDNYDADVSKQIREFGWYRDENFDTEILQRHLKAGMTFVDLGANVGFYTFLARSKVEQDGRVFAFEPFPRNAELIRASIKENSFKNVTLVEAAVSDIKGKATFYLSPDANSEHSLLNLEFEHNDEAQREIEVNVITVDSFFQETVGDTKIDFIKMDIEGSEYRALMGMKAILGDSRQLTLLTEFWPNGFRKDNQDPYEFLANLIAFGFKISFIDNINEVVRPVSVAELGKLEDYWTGNLKSTNPVMQKWGWYTNLLCMK